MISTHIVFQFVIPLIKYSYLFHKLIFILLWEIKKKTYLAVIPPKHYTGITPSQRFYYYYYYYEGNYKMTIVTLDSHSIEHMELVRDKNEIH